MHIHAGIKTMLNIVFEGISSHGNNWNAVSSRFVKISNGTCSLKSVHNRHLHIHKNGIISMNT